MNELARHLHKLLLDSDFAIIPGFGGFIAHYRPAIRDQKNNLFIPPTRTIGFNDQLNLNDGLLIQSYMAVDKISMQKAQLLITEAIDNLRSTLEENGIAELEGIGTLYCDANNKYSFKARENALDCPLLYGLKSFEMLEINQIQASYVHKDLFTDSKKTQQKGTFIPTKTTSFGYIGTVAVSFIAIMSFFLFSAPIENTEIIDANYAKVVPTELWSHSKKINITTTPLHIEESTPEVKPVEEEISPETITISRITPSEKEVLAERSIPAEESSNSIQPIVKTENKPFHIIVASSIKVSHAEDLVNQLKEQGYAEAQVLSKQGPTRVSAACFTTKEEAYQLLSKVTENSAYQNAWVFQAN